TDWLNGESSDVLDRLSLTGLTDLTKIPTLPVTQLFNVTFSSGWPSYVDPRIQGDTLYFFTGTGGYWPSVPPTLDRVSAYNWTSGQLGFNQSLNLSQPFAAPPLFAVEYPSPGADPLSDAQGVILDFARDR